MKTNNLKTSLVNTPILLIFFSRPDTLKRVFEKIKEARPSVLFLACDGPRNGNLDDEKNIELCKRIVEDIDWDCRIYKNYADTNLGCGMRPQTAINWAFSKVDKLIILEDDCVPNSSFFVFMEEMLEKYKSDERIGLVCGFNHLQNWDCGEYSYFFTKTGPMAGAWGTWKRVWDMYDYNLDAINDKLVRKLIFNDIYNKRAKKRKIEDWVRTSKLIEDKKNITYWDYQFGFLKYYQSYLSIVPRISLASNIGLGENSTHAKRLKNIMPTIFYTEDIPLSLPLNCPHFVICDHEYDNKVDNTWGYPNPVVKNFKRAIRFVRRIFEKS